MAGKTEDGGIGIVLVRSNHGRTSDSLPHNIADHGLKIAASCTIEVWRKLPIGKVAS